MPDATGKDGNRDPWGALDGDRPKETLTEDRLGYGGFAVALAETIAGAPAQDGIVLAVNGPWGSGKTSAVNMALDHLATLVDARGAVVVVRFNPWMFSGQEDLTRAFFSEVSAVLGTKVSSRVAKAFRAVARRASGTRKVIGSGLALAPGGVILRSLVENGLEAIGLWAGGEKGLDALRRELMAALREDGKRILVVMDDVDRLPSDEARQIFRMVKSVADLPEVVHLLVFDREVARRALGAEAGPDGPGWLEKIVQVSFDLPVPHRVDVHALLFFGLGRVVGTNPGDELGRWPDVFHHAVAPWLRTPRDVARLCNGVAAAWPLVRDKVDFADFVAVQALRLFEPGVYDVVRGAADELTGLGRDPEDQTALADRLLDAGGGTRRQDLQEALSLLFPRLERTWARHSYAGGFMATWDRARRICSVRRFGSYFSFTLDESVLTEHERQAVLASVANPAAFADVVATMAAQARRAGGTRADLLLDELANDVELVPLADRPDAAQAMLEVGDRFMTCGEDGPTGRVPTAWMVGWAVEALLLQVAPEARATLVEEAVANSSSLRTVVGLLRTLRRQHGLDGSREEAPPGERLVVESELNAIEQRFRDRMEVEARRDVLLGRIGLGSILYFWRDIAGVGPVREWTSRQLGSDGGTVALARSLTGSGVGQALGSYGVTEYPHVERVAVASIVNLDVFVTRLRELREGADPSRALVIDRFLKGLEVARVEAEQSG